MAVKDGYGDGVDVDMHMDTEYPQNQSNWMAELEERAAQIKLTSGSTTAEVVSTSVLNKEGADRVWKMLQNSIRVR